MLNVKFMLWQEKQYFLSNDLFNKINSEKRFVEIFHGINFHK